MPGSETSSRFVSDRVMLPLTPASVHAVPIERLCAVAELTHYSTRQCILTFFHPLAGKRDHNVGGAGRWRSLSARRQKWQMVDIETAETTVPSAAMVNVLQAR